MVCCTILVLLFLSYARTEDCWNSSEPSLGLSMLTPFNVSIPPEAILKGPLYQLGMYQECIYERKSQYCVADVLLSEGDNPDPFWYRIKDGIINVARHDLFSYYTNAHKFVKELTEVRTNYRRNLLLVALCVPEACNRSQVELAFFDRLETAAKRLGIHANVSIQEGNCQNRHPIPFDVADFVVAFVLLIIIGFTLIGTIYHVFTIHHYPGKQESSSVPKVLLCFSLIKNWRRLGTVSSAPKSKALRCIHGIRTLSLYFIITGHGFFFIINSPFTDPEYVEMSYKDFPRTFILNGFAILGTYFCVSGFLVGYMTTETLEKYGFTFLNYFKAFVHRYVRLTPAYAVMIALGATWFNYFGTGPLWPALVTSEVENCRHHWWINLLYLNNYFYADKPCLLHTWYLAADFQNYMVSILVLALVNKYRRWAKAILGSVLFLWMVVPFVQTYYEELEPMPVLYPETTRHLSKNKTFLRNYVTFHHNAASYFVGVICGYTYLRISTQGVKISKILLGLFWLIGLTVPWTIILLGYIFFLPSYVYDPIASSFYAAFCKTLYAAGIGVILLGCCGGYGWFANAILSWKPMQVIGRLTYCVYLIHFCIQRLTAGSIKHPLTITTYYGVHEGFGDIVVSFGLALILYLCIELPTSSLLKGDGDFESGTHKVETNAADTETSDKIPGETLKTNEKLTLTKLQNNKNGVSVIAL